METRANHIWVGAVTLLLLAALAGFIIWIARLNEGAQNSYDIFFKQSVDGLAHGSEVSFSGVPVGKIDEIELWPKDPSFVRVRISVKDDVPILEGTTATIQGSFTGVSDIQLEGAVKDAKPIVCPEEDPQAACPEGVPVIPTKQGGLGAILNSAPVLLERLSTVTERLNELLSDENQRAVQGILANTDKLTGGLAETTPDIKDTLAELRGTLRQAQGTLASFERVAGSTDEVLRQEGGAMARDLRATLRSANTAIAELEGALRDARPGMRQLSETTLPAAEAAIRELRATSRSLRNVTEKIDEQGAGALVGNQKLPEYEP